MKARNSKGDGRLSWSDRSILKFSELKSIFARIRQASSFCSREANRSSVDRADAPSAMAISYHTVQLSAYLFSRNTYRL